MKTKTFLIGVFLWSLAVGLREGFTWNGHTGLPLLDYHAWRMVEYLGVLLIVYALTNLEKTIMFVGGVWVMLFTVYEPALNWMVGKTPLFFNNDNPYTILGFTFNWGVVLQILFTALGFYLLIIGYLIDDLKLTAEEMEEICQDWDDIEASPSSLGQTKEEKWK